MYDVIVIGAGPAGSSAAKELASNGYAVLLVEKMKMPREKSCSGILIKKSMDLVQHYFGEETPKFVQCTPTDNRGMIFINDKGEEFRFEQEGLNIWRSSFDHWLAEKAQEAGAEVRQSTTAISCEEKDDCIVVQFKNDKIYYETAKFVIACDGAVSTIKRKLLGTPGNYITTYQTFNKGTIDLDPHYFYAYLQPRLSEYDAWFNVKDDDLIFGVAVKDTSRLEHYHSEFISYMYTQHNVKIEKQVKSEQWIMPHIMPGCPVDFCKGRVLFAGETAGFLNPMGEGISSGLESGHAAAQAIMQTSRKSHMPDEHALLSAYRENTAELRTYMLRQWRFVASIASTFSHMK
ncbi:NAD(P)/FAD-dependent oxidoreductase [Geosporobacter ferrireducens]|uniref:Fumarate reductase n=1 Tax=Geosporobacter ferrireducens TaxID=1424294 RepID=A0A1D8GPV3_9FIRM|nr:NAD(P)/FAD-dependent oxidoreductase [Geosporobacter ferrireducens]AOT72898.1 fumarate reductase [Geosporobacter ferrireducens]MTI55303.1 NAD(P)/FAD-dependent oxidoreductase [Geosporobacter ferrireducens]